VVLSTGAAFALQAPLLNRCNEEETRGIGGATLGQLPQLAAAELKSALLCLSVERAGDVSAENLRALLAGWTSSK
jgi:hypothetical protein